MHASIHIGDTIQEARDTKLGPEAREIQTLGEDALKNARRGQIIRISEVKDGDILW